MKVIKGYEDYIIDKYGNVFSMKYNKLKKLKPVLNSWGYPTVALCKNKKQRKVHIHKLIAENFFGTYSNKMHVNHIDGNKLNNKVNNLEIVTCSENIKHAYRIGLRKSGIDHHKGKLNENDIEHIKSIFKNKDILSEECGRKITNKVIGKMFNVTASTISNIGNENKRRKR